MGARTKKKSILFQHRAITGRRKCSRSLKPQKTRKIIRSFHVLNKRRVSCLSELNESLKCKNNEMLTVENYKKQLSKNSPALFAAYCEAFDEKPSYLEDPVGSKKDTAYRLVVDLARIDKAGEEIGGINAYQSASAQGQNSKRGGDSLKKLVQWLNSEKCRNIWSRKDLTALEIGSLSPHNHISTCGLFEKVIRIDLKSQSPLIREQDFMNMPLPKEEEDKFDLVSCSLVLNFVCTPKERGEMLRRITYFLKKPTSEYWSSVFIVLPLPCILNSRYFDNDVFVEIMKSLGFTLSFHHEATKVVYWLFDWRNAVRSNFRISKKEIHPGKVRNNFCITLA